MEDRELVEMAARACGYARMKYFDDVPYVSEDINGDNFQSWNPLSHDGDALRLAIKLNMRVSPGKAEFGKDSSAACSSINQTIEEATRRAIVLAAAEIGRGS